MGELISDGDGGLLIHVFVVGVAGRVGFAPGIAVVVVVEVDWLGSDEDDEAESEDWHLHYSND